jgi:hypothetical protein
MTSAVSKLNLQMAEQALRANRNLFSLSLVTPCSHLRDCGLLHTWASTVRTAHALKRSASQVKAQPERSERALSTWRPKNRRWSQRTQWSRETRRIRSSRDSTCGVVLETVTGGTRNNLISAIVCSRSKM